MQKASDGAYYRQVLADDRQELRSDSDETLRHVYEWHNLEHPAVRCETACTIQVVITIRPRGADTNATLSGGGSSRD